MKKLLYSIHIPWGWIKQRPQFIAEELRKYFDVTVFEKKIQKPGAKSKLPTRKGKDLEFKSFNLIPLYNPMKYRISLFDAINKALIRSSVDFKDYEYIWVTSIKYYTLLKSHISDNQIVIYDCMDDELAFPSVASDNTLVKNAMRYEKELVGRANHIICSSDNLKQVILNRTGINKDIIVVNNATVYPEFTAVSTETNIKFKSERKSLVYIGTVSEWFDFDSILSLLDKNPEIEIYLVGPIACEVPNHDRVNIMGSCEHKDIWPIMLQSDILIMPFKLNPLILSVNPVKLYEYIWSRKPVISIEYPESLKFSDFVYYYSEKESLDSVVDKIMKTGYKPKCQDVLKIKNFLHQNSWMSRVERIASHICQ